MSSPLRRRGVIQFRFSTTCCLLACLVASMVQSQESLSATKKVDPSEYDDRTLLDTFGEATKQYLTQKVIPPTDAECKWDWRSVRCEPFCLCSFFPKGGDYHLGRSCRITVRENCDPVESVPEANSLQLLIQRMVQGSRKVVGTAEHAAKTGYNKVQSRVCDAMQEVQCTDNGELPIIAWQERLFCQHKIPSCGVINDDEKVHEVVP